ncbi:hypothetical protein MLD52_20375 [Puniceicoccaceae bacterium K14]|nr:hypothetical protein [Puniceicoccaceae bacterium K14]
MKPLLVLGGTLAATFASTFLILAIFGGFGAEDARQLIETVSNIDKVWVAALLTTLLFADLFVAMPTLTLCILSGYYLGPWVGGSDCKRWNAPSWNRWIQSKPAFWYGYAKVDLPRRKKT